MLVHGKGPELFFLQPSHNVSGRIAKPTRTKKQLTPRQVALTKNLISGSTMTDAARKAGYSENNLAQSGHQALKAIRLRMPELMDDLGLTERTLLEKHLVPLLSANITKYFQHQGKVTDKRTVPDNDTRLRALETALAEGHDGDGGFGSNTVPHKAAKFALIWPR